jgi:hypothetical protein
MENEQGVEPAARTATGPLALEITPSPADSSPGLRHEPTCTMPPDVGELVFEVLVATMWSDGTLATSEVERGRAAAHCLGVRPRGGGAFAAIASGPLPFSELQFDRLSPEVARFTFAAARWLDSANAEPSSRRSGFLRALATRTRIADDEVEALRALVSRVEAEDLEEEAAFTRLFNVLLEQDPS